MQNEETYDDPIFANNLTSLPLDSMNYEDEKKSFCFVREDETLKFGSSIEFEKKFIDKSQSSGSKIVVVSIFGKIGDGKSHTLNKTIFEENIFKMSSEQGACTRGVDAAYHPKLNVLCFDTEGMPGSSGQEYCKTRLLWKV